MVKMTRSKTFQAYLPSCHRTYSCIHCRAHLANHDELISKSFQGSQGRAYLFNSVVNVGCGPAEERVLLTGLHAVADIYCENCKTTLGWKYVSTWVRLHLCLTERFPSLGLGNRALDYSPHNPPASALWASGSCGPNTWPSMPSPSPFIFFKGAAVGRTAFSPHPSFLD
ncbi:protein yippee-like 2 isoform X1 [Varanus komodoensis]|uniref:protein yippee-like 2 isoform X1 n=1 Tax=Varanus komodoensis TaxID=61221 RepID=UPI001CF7A7FA|nr:protein yippee-like 2 isoform X1 [Varanus komodoensis]